MRHPSHSLSISAFTLSLLTALTISLSLSNAEEAFLFLPFDVSLGGQKAEIVKGQVLFAVVPKPVQNNAVIIVDHDDETIIINAFPCDSKGHPHEGKDPAVILMNNSNTSSLDATMNKKPLGPGTYIANVVAGGKTSRIFFTVAPPAAAE